MSDVAACFPPWSHHVRLLAVKNEYARTYEDEAPRCRWTIRQLDRHIQSQFYERTALSRNKAAMLSKRERSRPEGHMSPEEDLRISDFRDDVSGICGSGVTRCPGVRGVVRRPRFAPGCGSCTVSRWPITREKSRSTQASRGVAAATLSLTSLAPGSVRSWTGLHVPMLTRV
jgi:hypothetical protein